MLARRVLNLITEATGTTGSRLTIDGLIRSTHKYGQWKLRHMKDAHPTVPPPTADLAITKITAGLGVRTLTFSASIKSMSDPSGAYHMVIQFQKVQFSEVPQPGWPEVIVKTDKGENRTVYASPGTLDTPVALRCTCPNFAFTFWYPLKKYKAAYLSGMPKQLSKWLRELKSGKRQRKRKPVNPEEIPGVCKHLMSFFIALRDLGYLKAQKLW